MAGLTRTAGAFAVTPHKISVCILLQIYAPSAQMSLPFPFSSVAQHNRLGLYLLSLTKSCDDIFEPKLEKLINQLREVGEEMDAWLTDHLTNRFSSLASPDDLLNFFNDMRGILGSLDSGVVQDDQIILDPNSNLGMFVRRCILAFNLLSFEGVCHLFSSIEDYCKEAHSSFAQFGAPNNNLESLIQYDQMDMENYAMDKPTEEIEFQKTASGIVPFHLHTPDSLMKATEGLLHNRKETSRTSKKDTEATPVARASTSTLEESLVDESLFLRTNLQIQGFLMEQADAIEIHGSSSSFSSSSIESFLDQLQKLAPELHRVHFLRYLNKLHSDDYFAALDNLLRYFDYSAGTEGFDLVPPSTGCSMYGRYEIGLLCLGMMHFRFGHPNLALEVLTEAVRVSQQLSNDTCLAYTLAAMSNLLSEMGIASTSGVLGSSYSPVTSTASSLSVQQRVYILLKESLRRADSLKLRRLVASNHLAMAKFELMHVQRPLLSFGPKASMRHKTCPVSVCKEIRLGAHLISDFSSESSTMTIDGSLSSAWLKDLQKPWGPPVISPDSGSRKSSTFFQLCDHLVSIPGSVSQLIGASYLLRATSWELYGSAPMARMNTLVYATLFGDSSSSSDAELAYLKLIQHLALYKGYKDAFAALKVAEEKFLTVSKSKVLLLKLQLLHERALHCGNLKLAQRICNELGGLASTAMGVDMELKVEASLREARTLLAAKQYSQAANVAHSLFCTCHKFNLQIEKASVLLLLAEIHKKSGNAVLGLPYALASISFCQSFNLDLLKASATLTLAELWLGLGSNHTKRALDLLHGAFPMILGHGGLELRARAYIFEANCYLSDPSSSVSTDSDTVLDSLRQASDELQALEYHELAAEASYLMAMVYDKLGRLDEREEAASLFKKHIIALENPQDVEQNMA
ncbi:anaphase-promoting complex subunit [Arabidopsis thaliana]|uniref:Anaphase-promoting complex subunit 5 n=1 Tax=Arabidopsis thaliana TaxID=3702 RepID=APC5_ARATH|nr:anaphase-promoting complex subunit [Arabidopsis thaliana]Q8H1U4.1 RecName: Full=Anaphase-promoting complex subunit 5; AltName: Full=Cyclosome subunit 5 [Arabidopsis thaliana]AAN10197.1 APC5 [Arabidopsis thaliana]AEE28009.1 anaphase-promoting complex subunit [Arabidopsis thaliana]|eukprot:NP_172146.2 anaphase-promoting complex subunit [Arabidopsis thaliana]